jgi:tetratricopeptide (TPR) repeat protein
LRRDLLVTALLFLAVGFLGGLVYSRHIGEGGRTAPAPMATPAEPSPAAADSTLPEGHPPLDLAQRWQELKQAAETKPRDPRAAIELANFLFDHQRWEEAATWYQRSLELDPKNTDARTDLATCYFNLNKFAEAAREYDRVLKLEPDKPQALYGQALVRLRGEKNRAAAEQLYERLRQRHPEFPGVGELAKLLAQEPAR